MNANRLVTWVDRLAVAVFAICVYAFLLGNGVFEGKFENEPIPWYFLAKGMFCAAAMMLLVRIFAVLSRKH